jgi:hypothetical protein
MPDDDATLAERLIALMTDSAEEALLELGKELKMRTIADLPVGDPAEDPNPAYSLRDHVEVRQYGRFVSVSVEGAYAAKQHEAIHFEHPRGGHAKYLERNAIAVAAEMEGRIAGVVQRNTTERGRSRTRVTSIGG